MDKGIKQKMKNKAKILITLLFLTILLSSSVKAAELSGVLFNDIYQDQGINMRLQGLGLKKVFFFKAFVAGYYTDMLKNTDPLGEVSRRIEVEYFVNIPGEKLNRFTIDQMKQNISPEGFKAITDQIKLMREYFVDLKPGDRFSLTYIPGIGTKFVHNGRLTGTIRGKEFARALFSVWIGQKPFDAQLKDQIIGLANQHQGWLGQI